MSPAATNRLVLARFADDQALIRGAEALRRDGYTRFDTHSPYPIEELGEVMEVRAWPIAIAAALAGLGGAAAALAVQVYANLDYPLNIGGRAVLAWTAFSLPALQFGTLAAVIGAIAALLVMSGLPRLSHPVFDDDRFRDATDDGFFISVDGGDPRFAPDRAAAALKRAGAVWVRELPP